MRPGARLLCLLCSTAPPMLRLKKSCSRVCWRNTLGRSATLTPGAIVDLFLRASTLSMLSRTSRSAPIFFPRSELPCEGISGRRGGRGRLKKL